MECKIREWKMEDAARLAEMLNNRNILNNLRDGLHYPYTEKDAEEFNYDEYRGTITYCVGEQSVVYSRRASGRWQPDVKNNIFDLYGFASVVHIST